MKLEDYSGHIEKLSCAIKAIDEKIHKLSEKRDSIDDEIEEFIDTHRMEVFLNLAKDCAHRKGCVCNYDKNTVETGSQESCCYQDCPEIDIAEDECIAP